MKLSSAPLALLALAASAQAALLTLQSPRFQVTGGDGAQLRTEP